MSMLNSVDSRSNWAIQIKILLKHDFEREWNRQVVHDETEFLRLLKNKMIENYSINWKECVESSVRYSFYRIVKSDHCVEPYLYALDKRVFRDALIRFRMGITELFVHKHRYSAAPFTNICPLCMKNMEEEIHFFTLLSGHL